MYIYAYTVWVYEEFRKFYQSFVLNLQKKTITIIVKNLHLFITGLIQCKVNPYLGGRFKVLIEKNG